MNRTQTGWTVLVGGVLAVVGGLFLPWATISSPVVGAASVYGSQGDGQLVAVAGALAIVAGILVLNDRGGVTARVLSLIGAAGTGLIAYVDYPGLADMAAESPMTQVGTGMYLVIVSAVVMAVGTVFTFNIDGVSVPTPRSAEEEALSERTRELMESDGLRWKQAWKRAVTEATQNSSVNA
jgi:hypothetical protein